MIQIMAWYRTGDKQSSDPLRVTEDGIQYSSVTPNLNQSW